MAKIMSLDGAGSLGATKQRDCKCVRNKRTGKTVKLCRVPKSSKHRSGWSFVKGGC
jgi:hypothetical protein